MIELIGKYNSCKIFIDDVEEEAISLIQSILDNEIYKGLKIRIMVDCHLGKGIVIGFTMELGKYLNPNFVGVDIGCGMLSGKFSKNNINLKAIDKYIRNNIPMGFNIHKNAIFNEIPYNNIQDIANKFINAFNKKYNTNYTAPIYNEKWLNNKLKDIGMDNEKFYNSIGTMGSGNHYIELGINDLNEYYATVHSGSRNFGLKIAEYWIGMTKVSFSTDDYNNKLKNIIENTVNKKEISTKIAELKKENFNINKDYLEGENLINYLFDMIFAQQYAVWNRTVMLNIIKDGLDIVEFDEIIETTHNYVDFNDFIIRKGAISSYKDQKMIIPFNMRDGMIIAEGKSNEDWNFSCAHGSGRLMSRTKAKDLVDLETFKKSMKGIYSTSVKKSTLDESPFAYKDSEMIEKLLEPTISIIDRVKPILNIKDSSEGESWKDRKKNKKIKLERAERRNLKNKNNG